MKSGYNVTELEITEESKTCQHLTQEEREVVLIYNDKDKTWIASCSIPSYMRKFEKQGWKCLEHRTEYYKDGEICTKFYKAPKQSISIGKYERPKRVMSEEHKEKLRLGRENLN